MSPSDMKERMKNEEAANRKTGQCQRNAGSASTRSSSHCNMTNKSEISLACELPTTALLVASVANLKAVTGLKPIPLQARFA